MGRQQEVYQSNLVSRPEQKCKHCAYEAARVSDMHKTMKNVYDGMIGRCYFNTDELRYDYYGGRGIRVTDHWLEPNGVGFLNFWKDVGDRVGDVSLDRIDPDGDYCKENCRWVSRGEQSYNKRRLSKNKSGRTGVCWNVNLDKWEVYIGYNGEHIKLGYFSDFEAACLVRQAAELKYYGYTKE